MTEAVSTCCRNCRGRGWTFKGDANVLFLGAMDFFFEKLLSLVLAYLIAKVIFRHEKIIHLAITVVLWFILARLYRYAMGAYLKCSECGGAGKSNMSDPL